jgi:DNA topoisomerase-1
MANNLVIVESPAKAKTIEKFLGKDYTVKSSFGHVRDLAKKDFGIDIENDFAPNYEVPVDKKKLVAELKKLAKSADTVWLAADEDREGEAIAWHLYQVLDLDKKPTKRIVFHEITKNAILEAIETPRDIDINLVNSQQARRILDRLVGFEISPVLWRKVKPSLSAGRVQSVAVRLIVEREKDINDYKSKESYKTIGFFKNPNQSNIEFKAEVSKNFDKKEIATKFINDCVNSDFTIEDVSVKPSIRKPAPPFTTSTLQQEAGRKFGFSVAQTMSVAQKLYEAGHITYMRTDSVNLSSLAINTTVSEIKKEYGENFVKVRKFETKVKGAQEAHEAIRPTYIDKKEINGAANEKKLYDLIRKRTLATQMANAEFEKTVAKINVSKSDYDYTATGEVLKFEGFLKAYMESDDDENNEVTQGMLPKLIKGDKLDLQSVSSTQKFSHHPARYTEASLVKKMEELGIGRPSTYAPTISTIQNREYTVKEDREGKQRNVIKISIKDNTVVEEKISENYGYEKSKLFPTDIGIVVNDFLVTHFEKILNYNFTAKVEEEFDLIANGKYSWTEMLKNFYSPFHKTVEDTLENSERNNGEKLLGKDTATGKPVYVKIGRYGPMVQIGETLSREEQKENPDAEKPTFAGIPKGVSMQDISLEQALELFKLPRDLGVYEDKKVVAAIGRFGPYIRHDSKFVSLKKDIDDPYTVELERAIELIEEKRKADREKVINIFENEGIEVLNGRWGPYIKYNKKNYKISKKLDAKELTEDECKEIIASQDSGKTKTDKKTKVKKKK